MTVGGGSRMLAMASDSPRPLPDLVSTWEEDRKFILRGWSLVFSILATLMMLSVVDGRMAYLQGSYTGYVGFWTDCRRHKCAIQGQVTVLIHMSKGFMMLALATCLVLLPAMGISFWPAFRRLSKVDLVFSSLSISIGLLIVLSLTLFVVNCQSLHPRPQVSYLVTFYLSWCASVLMLWAGALSYLNQVGMWSKGTSIRHRQGSYRRWALQQCVLRFDSKRRRPARGPEPSPDPPTSCAV
ncbi:transmembrane protein 202 isoform X2 [Oryctolagus cuniculus]|uniref:transmembrane protein 202 isoform X2 n=1 Tax=Oryctolagus cuniculus TaxID=9986 RepID=UPI002230E1FE|nr:uncharacterized protein LOC127489395 isoform X1 [Oryctolagus cuniculus]